MVNRKTVVPVVRRHCSNNTTTTSTGYKYKFKTCTCCNKSKVFSDFYVRPGKQDIARNKLKADDFRHYCIKCFDNQNRQIRENKIKHLRKSYELFRKLEKEKSTSYALWCFT